ncbi:MAG: DUF2273 domain-containing protein [Firmicutes bacterium]|nr:DUF2273 domain-containing protein [Bacillota bacterium]
MEELLKEFLPKLSLYRARIFGSIVGFIAGLLWAFMGFRRALAFVLCIFCGYYLGKRVDQKGSLREIFEKVFPPKE